MGAAMLINQMPRMSLVWLFITQTLVMVPHFEHLPRWIILAWLLVLGWRIQMYRGLWRLPNKLEKIVLVSVCLLGLWQGYSRWFALEPMVGLLVIAFILKMLEMRQRHELLLVIFIGFFVTATQFLFSFSIVSSLYGVFSIVLLLISLVAANQSMAEVSYRAAPRKALLIFLQSLPIMFLLFIFVPKIGSLWSVPSLKNSAQTGVSNSMSPGDFSRLGRSTAVAFRARFENLKPLQSQLYWRGLVFSVFDGRRWSQLNDFSLVNGKGINQNINKRSNERGRRHYSELILSKPPVRGWQGLEFKAASAAAIQTDVQQDIKYELLMEPTQQSWLYTLAMPKIWPQNISLTRDMTLLSDQVLSQRFQYVLTSNVNYQLSVRYLSVEMRQQQTQLPTGFNPKTRTIALRWLREEGSPKALMDRLLRLYQEKFTYTLQPPLLGRETVDEFLWRYQRGFCEHFSSSFVFFMRAAGIPARVVVGYQGGELNHRENYWIIRQQDAHAWAEVWFKDVGWQRVDPTAAVAPERIEQNLQGALDEADVDLMGGYMGRWSQVSWLHQLQLRWDASNYQWQRWVLGFNSESQTGLLRRWLGGLEPWRLAVAFTSLGIFFLGPLILRLLWLQRRPTEPPATRCLRRLEKKLQPLGWVRSQGETLTDFIARIIQHSPELTTQLTVIVRLYELIVYAGDTDKLQALRRRIKRFNARAGNIQNKNGEK